MSTTSRSTTLAEAPAPMSRPHRGFSGRRGSGYVVGGGPPLPACGWSVTPADWLETGFGCGEYGALPDM